MQTAYSPNMMTGLPDPRSDVEFYEGVPSKRLFAWVIDAILIIVLSVLVVLVMGILTIGVAFFHTGLYTVMVMTFFGQVGSIITMITTEYGRSIPDIVLGSTAINKPLQ